MIKDVPFAVNKGPNARDARREITRQISKWLAKPTAPKCRMTYEGNDGRMWTLQWEVLPPEPAAKK